MPLLAPFKGWLHEKLQSNFVPMPIFVGSNAKSALQE